MAAVHRSPCALRFAAEECKADREIVLAAVKEYNFASSVYETCNALEFAAEECKRDREIVLAAVQKNGWALQYAAEECKADRQIVLEAVEQNPDALRYASDELLLDSTFASEAKKHWCILKVSMLSGRLTVVMASGDDQAEDIVGRCCHRLTIHKSGQESLVHWTEVVPATAMVRSWPGLRPAGE
eukprot:5776991-Amphidinium_carterae.1